MNSNRKKLLLIGVDQAIPYLLNKFLNEGILPNISQLLENGVYTEGYSCPPCDTPTNWTTIATGATTAVHGATSFYLHIPGDPFELGLQHRSRTQLSRFCKAEYLWDVADRNGYTPFVINYPSGWPANFKNGAMSLLIWQFTGDFQIYKSFPRVISHPLFFEFSSDSEILLKRILKVKNNVEIPKNKKDPLQISVDMTPVNTPEKTVLTSYITSSTGQNYDSLSILNEKNNQWIIIKKNGWSDWIKSEISTNYGVLPCLFKIKILELSAMGSSIKIQTTSFYNTKGWTKPEELGEDLIKNVISYDLTPKIQEIEYKIEGKVESYLTYARKEALTLGNAIKYAKNRVNWNVCYFHVHLLDSVNHKELAFLDKNSPLFSEKNFERASKNVRIAYKIIDDLVGDLLNSCVDHNTITIFVSDHGAMPAWKIVNIPSVLMKADLLNYNRNESQNKFYVDWKNSYAFPYVEPTFIWVNLKGRDPYGIVSSTDFESIRDKIIEVLYDLKDPETGEKVIKLALKREEADYLGLNGDRIGDVIYFLNPPYQIYDEILEQLNPSQISPKYMAKPVIYPAKNCFGAHAYYLPNEKFGNYSNSVPLIISGPNIKKGIELKYKVDLIDLAPTFAHCLEIPKPKDSQGRVLFEVFD
ncbi:MAG: alkaline phosphatase family protein [Promethearchaeota archaeon]